MMGQLIRRGGIVTAFLAFLVVAVPAQRDVAFELKSMSEGSFTAFTTEVEGADDKLALEEWRKLMKEYGGRGKRSKPERYKVEEVVISSIGGSDPLAVYADFDERGSRTKVYVWIKQRGEFLGEASAERDVENAVSLVEAFGLQLQRAAIQRELDEEEKELEKVERKLRNLERDYDGYTRDIERAKDAIERAEANIERAEANIVKNGEAQEQTKEHLADQQESVEAVRKRLQEVGN